MPTIMIINKPTRHFVAQDLKIENWDSIAVYFKDLVEREINSLEDFTIWLRDNSELEAILEEDAAFKVTDLAIDGTMVMELLNIPAGPDVGKILKALLEEVLDDASLNTKEILSEMITRSR